jgi:DNA-binding transcriptional LysR family regulator
MLDMILLRSLVTVVDAGNFTRAAEQLNLTQSAVSAHVRRLEEYIGHRLLERTTRTVELTSTGRRLVGYARGILALNADAQASLGLIRRPLVGSVRIGANEGMAQASLMECLRQFETVHETVEVELRIGLMGDLLVALDAGDLDIILGSRCGTEARGEVLWSEPLVWAAAVHFENNASSVPLALYPDACPYRAAALEALARNGHQWRIIVQSPSTNGLLIAATAGLGIMPMTRSACITAGLREIAGLPALPDAQFVLVQRATSDLTVTALRQDLRRCTFNREV